MPDERVRKARENRRILGLRSPGLFPMIFVVETHAEYLVGIADYAAVREFAAAIIDTRYRRQAFGKPERAGMKEGLQVRQHRAKPSSQIEDAISMRNPVACTAIGEERYEPHRQNPFVAVGQELRSGAHDGASPEIERTLSVRPMLHLTVVDDLNLGGDLDPVFVGI